MIELTFLKGREKFGGMPVHSVIRIGAGKEAVTTDF